MVIKFSLTNKKKEKKAEIVANKLLKILLKEIPDDDWLRRIVVNELHNYI